MVSIHDNLENAFIFERVTPMGDAWIGFIRPDTDAAWYWTDNTNPNFTNWCAGQPTGTGERYAWVPSDGTDCWHTSDVHAWTQVICKVPEL